MTTVPAKSHQPLHNFSLPFLKWGQRSYVNTSNRCRRLLSDSSTNTNPHRRASPAPDSEDLSESEQNNDNNHENFLRTPKDKASVIDEGNGSVLLERENNSSKVPDVDVGAAADGEVKSWNLRPRKSAISNSPNQRVDGNGTVTASGMKSGRSLRGVAVAVEENEEDNKNRKLWISLSKEEIEEDVYALTGSKPARRPKKRNKTVQKQVDNLFPGVYLVGISADSYRV
ncbi:hypothetical protein L1887_28903 [Cichorium endivia]|nr:hypothetical protein L1887_28903 [Cichorium endivia]